MNKKLISEINRYKQLMGIVLITESGKIADEYLPLTPRSIDNLIKSGVDFTSDLTKLSDEFTARGIKTFADLGDAVAKKQNVTVNDITDEMVRNYIKNDENLYKSILIKASTAAETQVNILIKNIDITKIFSKNKSQLDAYMVYISTAPSVRNIDVLTKGLSDSLDEIDGIIDDIQTGKVPGVNTVPKELEELQDNLLSKKSEVDEFKYKQSTPTPSKNVPTEVKWGNLGKGYIVSNKITNYGGRYVVMLKDPNGRLRPFYQRTGDGTRAGDAPEGWASAGNWVPFYGMADVSFYRLINEETQEWGWKRTKGWFIKPKGGRQGEEGDEVISKLLADVVGTNGIKDANYDFGNLSKSITNTESASGLNTWLRNMGYDITPENGSLKDADPNRMILHGIL